MAYDSDEKPLVRARVRRTPHNWRTTGVTAYYFFSQRPDRNGNTEHRTYVTIKDLADQTELRFSRSQIGELHAMLGGLINDADKVREELIAATD